MNPFGIATNMSGAVREAHDALIDLADAARRLGERHKADQDVFEITRVLALELEEAAEALESYDGGGQHREPDRHRSGGALHALREKASEALGSRPQAGALLLADLRRFLAAASDASVTCVICARGAQATGARDLLAAITAAHDAVLRTHRWALTRLEETAPQVLAGP